MTTMRRASALLVAVLGLAVALLIGLPATAMAQEQAFDPWGSSEASDELALDPQADEREVITEVYINTANIYGQEGEAVGFTATCPKDAPYNCGPVKNGFGGGAGYELWHGDDGTTWYSSSTDFAVFQEGVTYYYSVYIWADDYTKYRFDKQKTRVFLNGRELDLDRSAGTHMINDTFVPTIDVESSTGAAMGVLAASYAPRGPWERLWGMTALDTMASIAVEGWEPYETDTVVIATMSGYYDALAAAPLAGAYDSPILLTKKTELSPQVIHVIHYLHADHAVIVGGEAAVSKDVEDALKAELGAGNVDRIWGENAQLTAIEIGEEAVRLMGPGNRYCIVATSKSYHDALSVAPIAYRAGWPIFLTNNKGVLSQESLDAIRNGGYQDALIVGGEAAIPQSTCDALWDIGVSPNRPAAGETALETSEDLADWALYYFRDTPRPFQSNNTGVATMYGYHDALAGAALCGKYGSPLILVNKDPNKYFSVERFIWDCPLTHGYVFGGYAAVSDEFWLFLNDLTNI